MVAKSRISEQLSGSSYQTFLPAEAFRLCKHLEFHYTPKHGSRLNMAELEFSVLDRQCLDRRLPDLDRLRREIAAWEATRNTKRIAAQWRFTVAKARTKLRRLYPA